MGERAVSDSPIHKFENAVITPHLGASTKEAQVRAATQIAEYVIAGLEGKTVATAVNAARIPADVMAQLKYFIPVAQRGGEILSQVVGGGIEKLKVTACGKIADTGSDDSGNGGACGWRDVQQRSHRQHHQRKLYRRAAWHRRRDRYRSAL